MKHKFKIGVIIVAVLISVGFIFFYTDFQVNNMLNLVEYSINIPKEFNASFIKFNYSLDGSVWSSYTKDKNEFQELPYLFENTDRVGERIKLNVRYYGGSVAGITGSNVIESTPQEFITEKTYYFDITEENNNVLSTFDRGFWVILIIILIVIWVVAGIILYLDLYF